MVATAESPRTEKQRNASAKSLWITRLNSPKLACLTRSEYAYEVLQGLKVNGWVVVKNRESEKRVRAR